MADSSDKPDQQAVYSRAIFRHLGQLVVEHYRGPECDTVQLWAEGHSVDEIAAQTGCHRTTIFHHLKQLRTVLGARNNRHLAALAVASGLAELDAVFD